MTRRDEPSPLGLLAFLVLSAAGVAVLALLLYGGVIDA